MTFQPIIVGGGNLGWSFLSRTKMAQETAFRDSPAIAQKADYFRENIRNIGSAEALVADRRLMEVALTAFGLADDIDNRFFIRKVLEDGVLEPDAFANRLSDKRYFAMAEAFRFDLSPPNTVLSTFAEDIISRFETGEFEVAVGEQDGNLRLALSLERELSDLLQDGRSETAVWFSILGSPPLRRVFEGGLGLPAEFAGIDIDRQLEELQSRAKRGLGIESAADLADPAVQETLIRRFLLRADLDQAAATTMPGRVALSLLQASPTVS